MYIELYKIPNKALSCLDPTSPVCVCVVGGLPYKKVTGILVGKLKSNP